MRKTHDFIEVVRTKVRSTANGSGHAWDSSYHQVSWGCPQSADQARSWGQPEEGHLQIKQHPFLHLKGSDENYSSTLFSLQIGFRLCDPIRSLDEINGPLSKVIPFSGMKSGTPVFNNFGAFVSDRGALDFPSGWIANVHFHISTKKVFDAGKQEVTGLGYIRRVGLNSLATALGVLTRNKIRSHEVLAYALKAVESIHMLRISHKGVTSRDAGKMR